jgi:hypothetical protein
VKPFGTSRLLLWWRGLLGWQAAPPRPAAWKAETEPDDEERLATYLRRIGVLDERPETAEQAALLALERLGQSGKMEAAIRLGGALAAALPNDSELQLRVSELLWRQQLGDAAQPLLARVLLPSTAEKGPAPRLRARWLLCEIAAAAGQHAQAIEQLCQILAEDWDYPGAKERLRTERALLFGTAASASFEVPPPLPDWTALSGTVAAAAPTLLGGGGAAAARYKLRRELGCGSSGAVYLAEDQELGCEVALKLFHPTEKPRGARPSTPESFDERALYEARLLSSLRHPGVLFLYAFDPAGRYLTMELCQGGSLRARLRDGPLPEAQAVLRAAELCSTLAAVHGLGVIHGDIKPENLLFRSPQRSLLALTDEPPYGDLVLSDFGVARRIADVKEDVIGAGTRGYLAKERLHGGPKSPAADMYSLGVVLKEMLGEGQKESPGPRGKLTALRELVPLLLSADPAARPDAATALAMLQEPLHSEKHP